MEKDKFSLKKRLASFKFAFNGLFILIKDEHNARIHLLAACVALFLAYALNISILEWFAIILCITMVFAFELINSSIERLCDELSLEKRRSIKKIKDLAAASVLISAIASVFIGVMIFYPKLLLLLK